MEKGKLACILKGWIFWKQAEFEHISSFPGRDLRQFFNEIGRIPYCLETLLVARPRQTLRTRLP